MNTFQLLDSGDDILKINKDIFTVERFKELTAQRLGEKLNKNIYPFQSNIAGLLKEDLSLISDEASIKMTEIILCFPSEGMDCIFLKLGSKEWRKGKLRIQAYTQFILDLNFFIAKFKIELEFYPALPIEPESPLDEIRRSPDYPQLS